MSASAAGRGFSLTEVLVSIMIFSVVSLAMVLTLNTAVRIYREGEYSRAANDEAVTVLAALEADLDRMLPPAPPIMQGGVLVRPASAGWMKAEVGADGNCVIAFAIRNPQPPSNRSRPGEEVNAIVTWGVARGQADKKMILRRILRPLPGDANGDKDVRINHALTLSGRDRDTITEITTNCLHFGVWIATQEYDPQALIAPPADAASDSIMNRWERREDPPQSNRESVLPPWRGSIFDTEQNNQPYPSAVRFSLILASNSRFAPKGYLRSDLPDGTGPSAPGSGGSAPLVAGLSILPVQAKLRIGDEWVQVERSAGGRLLELKRGILRSTPAAHPAGTEVLLGRSWSLVRSIPK